MLPVSVCMIVKNEEAHIVECLSRLSRLDWEIIIVDTGSTDHTVNLASTFTEHIYSYQWKNDFADARNFAVSKASNDWILSIDCDEYLESENYSDFIKWFSKKGTSMPAALGRITLKNLLSDNDTNHYIAEYVTRFFHRNYYHFEGSIHEQLTPLIPCERITQELPLSFLHVGYINQQIRLQKADRNIMLLLNEIRQSAPSCYLYYQLGQCYFAKQDYPSAAKYYKTALDLTTPPYPEFVQVLIESYGYALLELKQYPNAMSLIADNYYPCFAHSADYIFLAGLILMNNGYFQQAIDEFSKATTISSYRSLGVNSYKAYYNIGVIYECCGNRDEALAYYQKCGDYPLALARIEQLSRQPY